MLEPCKLIQDAEDRGDFTKRLALMDEFSTLPSNSVWEYCCLKESVAPDAEWLDDLKKYENDVMFKRG